MRVDPFYTYEVEYYVNAIAGFEKPQRGLKFILCWSHIYKDNIHFDKNTIFVILGDF